MNLVRHVMNRDVSESQVFVGTCHGDRRAKWGELVARLHTPLNYQAPDNIGFLGLVLVKSLCSEKVFRLMQILSSGGIVKRTKGSFSGKRRMPLRIAASTRLVT